MCSPLPKKDNVAQITANKTIQHRKPIWNALSEFYLDTELQKSDYNRIAEIFIASKLKFCELKDIDLYEVFPVLKGNLMIVAGEWSKFEEHWLIENCKISFQKKNKSLFRFKTKIYSKFLRWMTKDHWKEIKKRM